MRSLVVMAMFASSLTYAAWNGYTETRDLELATDGIDILEIDAGAGGIVVTGAADASNITVRATIHVDDDEDDAIKTIEKHLVLKLEKKHDKAILDAYNPTGSTLHVNFTTSKATRWRLSCSTSSPISFIIARATLSLACDQISTTLL